MYKYLHSIKIVCIFTLELKISTMETIDYKLTSKINGNYTTRFANFTDGTFAKLTVVENRGLKELTYRMVSLEGNYDKNTISVSMGTLGEMIVVPISSEKASENQILNHKVFGKVTVVRSSDGKLTIELTDGTKKLVMEKFFMNGII